MQSVYLNGQFMPASEAKISPMDRGFLFGDGIYEVIPCFSNKPVGLKLHLQRMNNGLGEIAIKYDAKTDEWLDIIEALLSGIASQSAAIYIQVSRGADTKRYHAYPDNVEPTVFAYAFETPAEQPLDIEKVKTYKVKSTQDLRWKRCHIKSTSLLGNVLHFQQAQDAGLNEVILINQKNEVTEAAACNVFIIKNGEIATPPADNQILPGVTRRIVLDSLTQAGNFNVCERIISKSEIYTADEVWITSSSKEIAPVVEVDGKQIGNGKAGLMWLAAQQVYNDYKFTI